MFDPKFPDFFLDFLVNILNSLTFPPQEKLILPCFPVQVDPENTCKSLKPVK